MKALLQRRLPVFAAALWWGSLTAIGFVAVPLLFANLPGVAGSVAAKLFAAQTWVALACGLVLLASSRSGDDNVGTGWSDGALVFVIGGMLLALLVQFGVAPRIVARQNLALWHGVGTAMYAAQWLCAAVVLWKVSPGVSPAGAS